MTVGRITISNHVARDIVPRKSRRDLSCNPFRCLVGGDTERHDASPIVSENHESAEEPKADRRDDKKSMPAMPVARFCRKVFQLCDGGRLLLAMYLATDGKSR
jgi:hypothetical protein